MSDTPPSHDHLDYELLRQIDAMQSTSQRALAQRMGVSVGKVNYCLKAVIARGWVKMNNFRRADNKWAYAYLLTPSGASAKMQLARAFLERKEQEFERLRSDIDRLRIEVERDLPTP
jgi:MarR family transcriptional regulator, temperature-dependent positive regulator of motility